MLAPKVVGISGVFVIEIMASSESLGSSLSALIDYDIKEEVEKLKGMVDVIDTEGGRRLGNVEGDLAFLRKEFKRSVKKSESAIVKILANLEVKIEKLKLRVVKMECANNSGSSIRPYGKIN